MKPPPLSRYSHRLVLTTPAAFVGQLSSGQFDLNHAWPRGSRSREDNPTSPLYHSFFALSFLSKEKPGDRGKFVVLPQFSIVADFFCVFPSVFFGKRFQNLGFLETNGLSCVPDMPAARPSRSRRLLPFSSIVRRDLALELNLQTATPMPAILDSIFREIDDDKPVSDPLELAFTAGRFYLQALDLFEQDAELAYISLVNAGEVLAGALSFSGRELFDPELRKLLWQIARKVGTAAAKAIRDRLFQVRRKFRIGISQLMAPAFFAGHECQQEWRAQKAEDFGHRLNAAYDLRSKFLHTGSRFESWASHQQHTNTEIVLGQPAYGPAEWKTLITRIPTLVGLERVIRFALLKFIHLKVAPLNPELSEPSPVQKK